ncbi:protein RRP5 homolog [Clavelina lepadiformis]|uniref:protein RRP5 homolog n=1 Tax=Clavelina lepadiformis TaxID=159417 RepID=UPI0040413E97
MDDDECFPRGFPIKTITTTKKKPAFEKNENLFQTKWMKNEKGDRGKKSVKRKTDIEAPNWPNLKQEDFESEEKVAIVDYLQFKKLHEGMLLLGSVKEVHELELVISLPNFLVGYVKATKISGLYTSVLHQQLHSNETAPSLSSLFEVGQLVVCSVCGLNPITKSIQLTIDPQVVNTYLSLTKLKSGMMISCSVRSIEDHGYVVDVGKKEVNAFISTKQSDPDVSLKPLQVIRCVITGVKGEGKILMLSNAEKKMNKSMAKAEHEITLDTLYPGTMVKFSPSSVLSEGSLGTFLNFKGSITTVSFSNQLSQVNPKEIKNKEDLIDEAEGNASDGDEPEFNTKPKKKQKNNNVDLMEAADHETKKNKIKNEQVACVLYVTPSKQVALCANPKVWRKQDRLDNFFSFEKKYSIGQKCRITIVTKIKGIGIVCQAEKNGPMGMVYMKNLSDNKIETDFSNFTDKKNFKARVVENISLDGVLEFSLKQSTLDAAYLRYEDVAPGQLVKAKISSIEAKGLKVVLGSMKDKEFKECRTLQGFVPSIQMSDIVLQHPEKKFSKGDVLTCRVLTVNPKQRHLHLTIKSSLVNSKEQPVTSYEQLRVGAIVHPFIISIKDYGVIVLLYNNVKGVVPRSELSMEPIQALDKEFYIGQVVRSRVISVDPQCQQLRLSFRILSRDKENLKSNDTQLKLGQVIDGKVTKKNDNSVEIEVIHQKTSKDKPVIGHLHAMHLSDFKTISDNRFTELRVGSILNNCLVISTKPLKVTMKRSLIEYVKKNEESPLVFADLQGGLILPAYVHNVVDYGVFVGLPNGLVGLCPKSAMADHYLASSDDHFFLGQSVVANVTSVDEEKKRFSVSLRPSEAKIDESENRISRYYQEACDLQARAATLLGLSIKSGDVVRVNRSTSDGASSGKFILDEADNDSFTCVFVDDNDPSNIPCQAVVMHVDFVHHLVHLSNQKTVVKFYTAVKSDEISPNTPVYCHALYVNVDVTVAYVTSHGSSRGCLIFITSKTHWNDSSDPAMHLHKVGQMLQARVIKRCSNGILLGALKLKHDLTKRIRQDSEMSDSSVGDFAQNVSDVKVGEELQGTVRSIRATCAIVNISERSGADGRPLVGRLHASEVKDDVAHNTVPLRKIKVGESITCRVIGCRDVRTHKFLEITNRKATRGVLELSICRDAPGRGSNDDEFGDRFPVGKAVVAYVKSLDKKHRSLNVELEPGIAGYIPRLLVSGDPESVEKYVSKFRPGKALHCTLVRLEGHKLVLSAKGALTNDGNDVIDVSEGCILNGEVRKIVENGLLIRTGLQAQGKAFITDLFDDFIDQPLQQYREGDIVRCRVLECRRRDQMILSLCNSLVRDVLTNDQQSRDHLSLPRQIADLKPNQVMQGYVKSCCKAGIFVALSRQLHGRVTFDHASKYFCDETTASDVFRPGRLVKCCILSLSSLDGKIELSLLEDDVGEKDLIPQSLGLPLRKRKISEKDESSPVQKKKMRKAKRESKAAVKKLIKESIIKNTIEVNSISVSNAEITNDATEEPGFVWENDMKVDDDVTNQGDDDEDSGIEDKQISVKLTKKQKEEMLVLEEEDLRKRELELMDETRLPHSVDEWERLMASNSDNSMMWVRYMAFHLHAAEIEKARAVAEKALKTINFREEKEKLNIWVSLLNLENLYGSDISLERTLERALEQNDQLKVLNHLINIYITSGKREKAQEIHQNLIKKYRWKKEVWLAYMRHLMVENKPQEAHEVMKRSLKMLEQKQHLEVICKFAQMEFSLGEIERGRTIFENALSSYPKRTDVWSIYIDTLIKAKRLEDTREVFGRIININFSSKKMRSFFKRFVEFESKYGSESTIADAKQKALDYIEIETSRNMN